jgi:hypothetical protein
MTRNTRSISILADTRRRSVAVAAALAALALLGAVAAGTATAQNDGPAVVVTDGTTASDGTTTVGVVLTSAPSGLSGYYLDLTVGDAEVARIESVSYPDRFGLTSEPEIGPDGATVTLEAADIEGAIEPGATDVTLATVTVAGAAPGEAELAVEPRQFDADDGSAFGPATESGTVTVSTGAGTPSADGTADSDDGTDAPGSDTSDSDSGTDVGSTDDTDTAEAGSDGDAESTSGAGPLSPALVLVAVALLAAVGIRRRA